MLYAKSYTRIQCLHGVCLQFFCAADAPVILCLLDFRDKGKGPVLESAAYMSQTCYQKCFTIMEVASD